jgi:hypothetical protein
MVFDGAAFGLVNQRIKKGQYLKAAHLPLFEVLDSGLKS